MQERLLCFLDTRRLVVSYSFLGGKMIGKRESPWSQ